MNMRALVVDDEPLARERVASLLRQEPDVEIIGTCANGHEAVAVIQAQQPDLVFLDVQMPELSGFDVLRAVPEAIWPAVIFVTAHDQHAIEAFEIHALDYLLKPFKQARFREAVERARRHLQTRDVAELNASLRQLLGGTQTESPYFTRLIVKNGDRTIFVKVEEIECIEAAANYALLHVGKETHILRDTLSHLEAKLSPKQFLRISRSSLVNLDEVKELQPVLPGEHCLVLRSGRKLSLTRGVREIQERLQYG